MADLTIQKSFAAQEVERKSPRTGTLYLVGTPIGNLDDMTFRAVSILKQVTLIAAEDTRQTRKLLNHFDIPARLFSYHEHNKEKSGAAILSRLAEGESVALVSDAGLPAISDPGAELVEEAVRAGIAVVPIPGPNAALSALIASGLQTDRFTFLGFLPREKKKAGQVLDEWKSHKATIIFYEAPHRVQATLKLILESWGDRRITLARELTKRFEEFARGTVSSCLDYLESVPPIGEYCLVVEGAAGTGSESEGAEEQWWSGLTSEEHVTHYEETQGITRKEAIKLAAADRNVQKRELYNEIMKK